MDKRRGVAYVLQITQPNITPHTTRHRTFTYLSKVDSLSSHVYCCPVQVGDRMFGRIVSLFEPNGFSNLLCFLARKYPWPRIRDSKSVLL